MKKKLVILFISFIVIASIIGIYYAARPKSAFDTFLKAESNNFINYSKSFNSGYQKFFKKQEPYINTQYKKEYEITFPVVIIDKKPTFENNPKNNLIDVLSSSLKKAILKTDYTNNIKSTESLGTYSILLGKSPILETSIYSKNQDYTLLVPIFAPSKQFLINYPTANILYDYFNIPMKPKKLLGPVELANTIKYNKNTIDNSLKSYGNLICGYIDNSNVKFGKDKNEIIITLDKQKANKIIKELLKKISNDDALINYTYKNYIDILKLLEDFGALDILKSIYSNKLIIYNKSIPEFKTDILTFSENLDISSDLKMTLIVGKSYNILDRKLEVKNKTENAQNVLTYHSFVNDTSDIGFGNTLYEVSYNNIYKDNKNQSYTIAFDTKTKSTKNILFSLKKSENSIDKYSLSANLIDNLNNKLNFQAEFNDISNKNLNSLKAEVQSNIEENDKLKTKNIDSTYDISGSIPSLNIENLKMKILNKSVHTLNTELNPNNIFKYTPIDLRNVTKENISSNAEVLNAKKTIDQFLASTKRLLGIFNP